MREALEQQTATSDILKVIATSPTDVQPVLDAIAQSAARVCGASDAHVYRVDGDLLKQAAHFGPIPGLEPDESLPLNRESIIGRCIVDRLAIHTPDAATDLDPTEYPISVQLQRRWGYRTALSVPLMRDGVAIGGIAIRRTVVRPFTPAQIELLRTFAAQAVIAIENVRLFSETNDSLEQQIAMGDVLKAISRAKSDVQPVFDAINEHAARLCHATVSFIGLVEGDQFRVVASRNPTQAQADQLGRQPLRIDRATVSGRSVLERRTIHLRDVREDPEYGRADLAGAGGYRTVLAVPLLRDGVAIGTLALTRLEVRAFTDREIQLVQTFADQAVIAIENVRLFQAVERQRQELTRFVSPQVASLLTSDEGQRLLEGHRRSITVLFCDLRGFSAFSETAEPEEVLAVLREYHAAMGELIVAHSGTLENFAGDGMMVFFNDPVSIPDHERQAVQLAIAMRARFAELSQGWRRRGYELGFGIGAAVGHATLGRIGFEGRYDYGAVGNVVIVASRLCGAAKDGQILLTQRLHAAVEQHVNAEAVGELSLKGQTRPVPAFNVMALRARQ